ncbi:MAG: ATP-binding cassette domain-containing protein, partial [Candidatus Hermodarchaeota archaeon]|nr:ATP-binding cassette domain-containing protein [Candidatus Hermodarchaeota archaeon]
NKETEIDENIEGKQKELEGKIKFEDVTFKYPDDVKPVLKNISFEVDPGKTLAVVGATGSGKTTLTKLISRLYDVSEGRITIDDIDIRDYSLKSLRSQISYIEQDVFLFSTSIFDNISFGRASTLEKVIEVAKQAQAHDFISNFPKGYDSEVGERGVQLSGGERQRIAIARAFLANPKILILDEATSRLDAYSESLVQAAQEKLFANRTTVVIAHRLTTIANASRVLVFEHGELVEQGTHDELLALGGRYKAIYDTYYAHQTAEEISEEVLRIAQEELGKTPMRAEPPDQAPKKELMKRK